VERSHSGTKRTYWFFFAFLAVSSLVGSSAHAFPELIRHGYTNCTTCHLSPSGGGLPTEYGRALSKEVLSISARDGEEQFAYGLIKQPEWLLLGGDYRSIYVYKDNPSFRSGQYIVMQADLSAAIQKERWALQASVGVQDKKFSREPDKDFISRSHWGLYRWSDEGTIRGGKFYLPYGINTPEHTINIKRALGWDEGTETYNLETAWIGENWNGSVTAIFGRPDSTRLKDTIDTGFSAVGSRAIGTAARSGWSVYRGENGTRSRWVTGPYGLVGITPRFYWSGEIDFQFQSAKSSTATTQRGWVTYQKLGYELIQGLHVFGTQELGRLNFKESRSLTQTYGLGTQIFPRPHFEFNVQWQRQQVVALYGTSFVDFGYLMFHYYL
jgi:hypothetical protein